MEGLETNELKEQLEKALEKAEEAGEEHASPPWITALALSTAVIAVFAALASLKAGMLGKYVLLSKNEAVLSQARASDQWAYYQAKGIKGTMYQIQAETVADHVPTLAAKFKAEAARYKSEQNDITAQATALETKVKEANDTAERLEHQEHFFALAVTLFQVAIALSAVAVLTRRKIMWMVSLGIAACGALLFGRGFF